MLNGLVGCVHVRLRESLSRVRTPGRTFPVVRRIAGRHLGHQAKRLRQSVHYTRLPTSHGPGALHTHHLRLMDPSTAGLGFQQLQRHAWTSRLDQVCRRPVLCRIQMRRLCNVTSTLKAQRRFAAKREKNECNKAEPYARFQN